MPIADPRLSDSHRRTVCRAAGKPCAFSLLWELSSAQFEGISAEKGDSYYHLFPTVEAIAALCPWGVDVVSGVEAAPGRKDKAKVRELRILSFPGIVQLGRQTKT